MEEDRRDLEIILAKSFSKSEVNYSRLLRNFSRYISNISKDGDFTVSPGNIES